MNEHWSPSITPTPTKAGDPFQDDDLLAPPPVPSDARNQRPSSKTSLARLRVVKQEPTLAKPPVHHHSAVSMRFTDEEIETVDQVKLEVVPVSLQTTQTKPIPKNPLRD
jgi:hypothetical protein